jgi:lipoprotein-releasing system permease protein
MYFVFKVALRYIFAKTNDSFISFISWFCFLGITIGVAALIVVMSIMNGFHQELTRCIIGLNGHLIVGSNVPDIKSKLTKYDFITGVGDLIEGQGLVVAGDRSAGMLVKGVNIQDLEMKQPIIKNVFGNIQRFNNPDSMLIGKEAANHLNLQLGDKVKLIVPQTISSIFGSMPKSKEFKIIGIFSSGLTDYDSMNILIPLNTAEKMFGSNSHVLEIYTKDPEAVSEYTKTIYRDLVGQINFINNWKMTNSAILSALKVEKIAMTTVLSLIIIVAAFNIISSLFMLVKDKTKDIAILRTIGASKTSIMCIFIINGAVIGFLGTAIGVVAGQIIAKNINTIKGYLESFSGVKIFDSAIYFLYNLPAKLDLNDVWFVVVMSLSLCLLSTIYPAYRAAKLNPVDAIRYE